MCTHALAAKYSQPGTPSTHSRVLRVLACGGGGLALDRAEHVEADHVAAASVLGVPTRVLRVLTSVLRVPTRVLRVLTSVLRVPTSVQFSPGRRA